MPKIGTCLEVLLLRFLCTDRTSRGHFQSFPRRYLCGGSWGNRLSVLVWFLPRKTISVLRPGGEPPDGLGTDSVGSNMPGIDTSYKVLFPLSGSL